MPFPQYASEVCCAFRNNILLFDFGELSLCISRSRSIRFIKFYLNIHCLKISKQKNLSHSFIVHSVTHSMFLRKPWTSDHFKPCFCNLSLGPRKQKCCRQALFKTETRDKKGFYKIPS